MDYLSWPKGITDRDKNFLLTEEFILNKFRLVSEQINCTPIRIAPIGYKDTYSKVGHTTGEKTYDLLDRSGRSLVLTPDSSASVLRHYLRFSFQNNKKNYFFHSPTFRYRNRPNRFYTQIGFSIINGNSIYNNLDEDAFLILHQYLDAIKNIGLNVTISLSHFGLIRYLLSFLDDRLDHVSSDLILNDIRPLSKTERIIYFDNKYKPSHEKTLIIKLLTQDVFEINDLPSHYAEVKEITSFYNLLKNSFSGAINISFSDLRSSEMQNGIVYKIFHNNKKIGDGGCYNYKASEFHPKIKTVKSIAAVLEDLVEYSNYKSTIECKSITLLSIDCSFNFSLLVFNKIKAAHEDAFIDLIRSKDLKKTLSQQDTLSYLAVIKIDNEKNNFFELKNCKNGSCERIYI